MGIFGWLKPEEESEDRSLVEISNDAGDHIVADVPTEGEGTVRRIMRESKIERDRDDDLLDRPDAASKINRRDSEQHRYQIGRVINPNEDLEDSYDQENDTSDSERSEQSPNWWPF